MRSLPNLRSNAMSQPSAGLAARVLYVVQQNEVINLARLTGIASGKTAASI